MAIQRYIEIDKEMIPVTEEQYRAYMRPVWAEHKRRERGERCRDEKGNHCTKDCNVCEKQREGSALSLDQLAESGYEAAAADDIAESVADKLLYQELYAAMADLDPENLRIIELFSIGKTEREISAEIGLSQKGVNKRKNKLFALLRELLKNSF